MVTYMQKKGGVKKLTLNKQEIQQLIFALDYVEEDAGNLTDKQISLRKKLKRSLIPIKISSRKGKGRNLQKWVCKEISMLTSIPYKQSDDSCLIHSREMGQSGCDIILRGLAGQLFPFSVECKNSETLNLMKTIKQAKSNLKDLTDWMIVYKNKKLKRPVVIISWDCIMNLLKERVK